MRVIACIVHDLDTIIVLVLLSFNFIPQRLHHSLTVTRSLIRDSATVTLMLGDGIFSRMEKNFEVYRRNNNEPKTLPYGIPDTTSQLKIKAVATVDCGSIICCDIGAIRQRNG